MKQEITWEVSGKSAPAAHAEKMDHYEPLKIDADANEGQKEFARRYNAMRKKLLDHGLMHKK